MKVLDFAMGCWVASLIIFFFSFFIGMIFPIVFTIGVYTSMAFFVLGLLIVPFGLLGILFCGIQPEVGSSPRKSQRPRWAPDQYRSNED